MLLQNEIVLSLLIDYSAGEEGVSVTLPLFYRFSLHYHLRNHWKEAERTRRMTLQSKMKIQT